MLDKAKQRDLEEYKDEKKKQELLNKLAENYRNKKVSINYVQDFKNKGLISDKDILVYVLPKNELIPKIENDELDISQIKELINNNNLDTQHLKRIKKYLKKKYRTNQTLFNSWSKAELYEILYTEDELILEINKILRGKRIQYVDSNVLDDIREKAQAIKNQSQLKKVLGSEAIEVINTGVLPTIDIRNMPGIKINIDDLPEVAKKRSQIFVFGVAGSGKTSFLSGLVHYALSERTTINDNSINALGFNYVNVLSEVVKQNRLINRNPVGDFQYFTLDFIDGKNKHPLTFYEMSGETYSSMILDKLRDDPKNGYKDLNSKIKSHIFENSNPKIFFFVIDYEQYQSGESLYQNQANLLLAIAADMATYGVLKSTLSIVILVTKWDKAPQDLNVDEYIKKEFNALFNFLEFKTTEYKNLNFTWTGFSLGDFEDMISVDGTLIENRKYTYRKDDSERIYDWLCENTFATKI